MKLILRSRESQNICIEPLIQMAIPWIFCSQRSRDAQAAKRFFRKALNAVHTQEPRVITVDKNGAHPKAIDELKAKEELSFEGGITTEKVSE